jgi:predicted dehydrogenase
MIIAAKESGTMISVYHNRRWDADFCTLKKIVHSGVIGAVFRVEMWGGSYGKPKTEWWRGRKTPSGGSFYDWGAHYLDWLLGVIPEKMINVTGFFYDRVWLDVSNEDHVEASIRFANGCKATVVMSNITKVGRPRWTVWGEKGAIVSEGKGFKVYSELPEYPKEKIEAIDSSAWQLFYPSRYYDNIVAHITKSEELIIKAEEARRVIAIIELAEKSANTLQAEPVPYEFR